MQPTIRELEALRDKLPFKLYQWQWDDILSGRNYEKFALFVPVGGGKTVMATMIACAWGDPVIFVVVPPILITQWVRWLNSVPEFGPAVAFRGTPKQRYALSIEKYKWLVMSLDIFKIDYNSLYEHYCQTEVTLIVDEAHTLKNSSSKSFKFVQRFSAGGKLLLATGTELNDPIDAYAYIKLKTPGVYRTKTHFENMHVAQRDFYEKPVAWANVEQIATQLYTAATKHTKEEIHAHLPKANYVPITYDLALKHKKLYNKLADEMLLELPDGGKIDAKTGSALYNALQQIVVNWDDYTGETGHRPAIFDVIDQVFDEIQLGEPGSSKLIIWTWFKKTTDSVLNYVVSKYPGAAMAAYSKANSEKSVQRFLNDPTCLVLVAQPGSAGAGLNPQHLC